MIMVDYTVYHQETGEILRTGFSGSESAIATKLKSGEEAYVGEKLDYKTWVFNVETKLPESRAYTYTEAEIKRMVDEERDRRFGMGIQFGGKTIQTRPNDVENIQGMVSFATLSIMSGAQPGDFQWHGQDTDFQWIMEDNSLMRMDAYDIINVGKQLAHRKDFLYKRARELKDMNPPPTDLSDDVWWEE